MDADQDRETKVVQASRDVAASPETIFELIADPARAAAMGAAGREWMRQDWTWQAAAERLRPLLSGQLVDLGLL